MNETEEKKDPTYEDLVKALKYLNSLEWDDLVPIVPSEEEE